MQVQSFNSDAVAKDPDLARAYLNTRANASRSVKRDMLNLPYVAVRIEPFGNVLVGTTHCRNVDCAAAYILMRWW